MKAATKSATKSAVKFAVVVFGSLMALAVLAGSAQAGEESAFGAAQNFANGVNGRVVNCVDQADQTTSCRVSEYTTRGTVVTYQLACFFGSAGYNCSEQNRTEQRY